MKKMEILGKTTLIMIMMMMTLCSAQGDLSLSITRRKKSLEDFNQWVSYHAPTNSIKAVL